MLKNIRFLRKKLAEAAEPAPETPTREIPQIKGALPHEPDYPDGKFPKKGTAPRVSPPLHEMPPKPPGANPKK